MVIRSASDGFADLFSLAAVDELLSRRGLRTPFLRVAKDGQVVPPARFTAPGPAGATIADQVDADKLVGLYADGSTLVLQGLHQVWPPIADLTSQLAAELGHPVQVNAYVTPPQSQGFSAHYDTHDVFVLQVAGSKRWQIWQPVLDRPTADQPWNDRATDVRARAAEQPADRHCAAARGRAVSSARLPARRDRAGWNDSPPHSGHPPLDAAGRAACAGRRRR